MWLVIALQSRSEAGEKRRCNRDKTQREIRVGGFDVPHRTVPKSKTNKTQQRQRTNGDWKPKRRGTGSTYPTSARCTPSSSSFSLSGISLATQGRTGRPRKFSSRHVPKPNQARASLSEAHTRLPTNPRTHPQCQEGRVLRSYAWPSCLTDEEQ